MTWPDLTRRLTTTGYTHARCEGPGLAWRPSGPVERLLAAALAVAGAPVPARFDGQRLDATRLAGLRARLERVLDGLDGAEGGRHVPSAELFQGGASLAEPFLAKLLVLLDEDEMWSRTPRQWLVLDELVEALQELHRSPFDPHVVAMNDEQFKSPEGWAARDSLHNALRSVVVDRNVAAHGAPDPGVEVALRSAWSAVTVILAVVQHDLEAIEARVPQAAPPHAGRAWEDDDLREARARRDDLLRGAVVREDVLDGLEIWTDSTVEGGYLVLVGAQGLGKSTVMAQLSGRLEVSGGCLAHFVAAQRDPERILRSLVAQARRLLGGPSPGVPGSGTIECWREELVRALEQIVQKRGRAVVLVDGLDELDELGEPNTTFLPRSLPSGVRAVLATRPDRGLLRRLHLRLSRFERRDLPPFSLGDFRNLLERRLEASVARRLPEAELTRLFTMTEGNALLLGWATEQLGRARGAPVPVVAATLEELFRSFYEGVCARGDEATRALKLLCVARAPLDRGELSALSGVSPEDCDKVLDRISERLREIDGRFEPFHQGLRGYVLALLGPTERTALEAMFCAWLAADVESRYALEHRLEHLLGARRPEEGARLLLEPRFLEARAAEHLAARIPTDMLRVAGELPAGHDLRVPLERVAEAVRMDLHFVQRHPDGLFQCLWNRAWWYDGPGAPGPTEAAPSFRLHVWLEEWRSRRPGRTPWCRGLLPPAEVLGAGHRASVPLRFSGWVAVPDLAMDDHGRALIAGQQEWFVVDTDTGVVTNHSEVPEGTTLTQVLSDARRVVVESGADFHVLDALTGATLQTTVGATVDGDARGDTRWSSSAHRLAATASWDEGQPTGVVWVYSSDGTELRRLEDPWWHYSLVALSPDGRQVCVTASRVRIVDPETWEEGAELDHGATRLLLVDVDEGHELCCTEEASGVFQGAFSADGRRLAVLVPPAEAVVGQFTECGWKVFDTSSGSLVASGGAGDGHCLALSPDGLRLVVGGSAVMVWDVESGELLHAFPEVGWEANSPCFSPDGRRLATAHFRANIGTSSGTVRTWDLEPPQGAPGRARGQPITHAFDMAADGSVAAVRDDGALTVLDPGTNDPRTGGPLMDPMDVTGAMVRWLLPPHLLLSLPSGAEPGVQGSSSFQPTLVTVRADALEASATEVLTRTCLGQAAVSADGRWLAYCDAPGTLVVRDVIKRQVIAAIEGPWPGDAALATSCAGRRLAALVGAELSTWALAADEGAHRLWSQMIPLSTDAESPARNLRVRLLSFTLEYSPDGEQLRVRRGKEPRLVVDAATGARLGVPSRAPARFSAMHDGTEIVVLDGATPIAWFPASSREVKIQGTRVASVVDRHLVVFEVEGPWSTRR